MVIEPVELMNHRQSKTEDNLLHVISVAKLAAYASSTSTPGSESDDEREDFIKETLSLPTTPTSRALPATPSSKLRRTADNENLKIAVGDQAGHQGQSHADIWDERGPAPKASSPNQQARREHRSSSIEQVAEITKKVHAAHTRKLEAHRARRVAKLKTAPCGLLQAPVARSPSKQSFVSASSIEDEGERPVVIFDWDDTLLPTWFITDVIHPCHPDGPKYGPLPKDSVFAGQLAEHARLVRETLITAAQVAKVAIVTLAARPWVHDSAEWFLPDGDIPELLKALDIPVYYAREFVSQHDRWACSVEEGVDLYMIAKRNAMTQVLHRYCPRGRWKDANVTSIGDSGAEEEAMKEIMWEHDGLCKTVRLIQEPALDVLGMELQILTSWFPKLVSYSEDAHIHMDSNPTDRKSVV